MKRNVLTMIGCRGRCAGSASRLLAALGRGRSQGDSCPRERKVVVARSPRPTTIELASKYAYAQVLRHGAAGQRRPDRRDAHGRGRSCRGDLADGLADRRGAAQGRRRRADHVSRRRTSRSRCRSRSPGQKADYTVSFVRDVMPAMSQDGLQRRHLPRLAQRQERLQALAARLRPAVRPSRADRRHRRPALQSRRARSEPDAAQAVGRDSARRRRADAAGRAVLRAASLLDRRRREARSRQPARHQDRDLSQEPDRADAGHDAADAACWPPTPTARCAT